MVRFAMFLVRGYQTLMFWKPSPCRFSPSCSNYALEALEKHGLIRGTTLATKRIFRCHPFGAFGHDPVPD